MPYAVLKVQILRACISQGAVSWVHFYIHTPSRAHNLYLVKSLLKACLRGMLEINPKPLRSFLDVVELALLTECRSCAFAQTSAQYSGISHDLPSSDLPTPYIVGVVLPAR